MNYEYLPKTVTHMDAGVEPPGRVLRCVSISIVSTVNCVGVMGKGIVLQFKKKWPGNFKAYATECKAKALQTDHYL